MQFSMSRHAFLVLPQTTLQWGRGKTNFQFAIVSIFVRVSGKNSYFCEVPQQVLSEVVATLFDLIILLDSFLDSSDLFLSYVTDFFNMFK